MERVLSSASSRSPASASIAAAAAAAAATAESLHRRSSPPFAAPGRPPAARPPVRAGGDPTFLSPVRAAHARDGDARLVGGLLLLALGARTFFAAPAAPGVSAGTAARPPPPVRVDLPPHGHQPRDHPVVHRRLRSAGTGPPPGGRCPRRRGVRRLRGVVAAARRCRQQAPRPPPS